MNKKRFFLLSGIALVALLAAGMVGVSAVFAQEPTPEADLSIPLGGRGGLRGFGGHGFLSMGDDEWAMFDTVAETLGLTPEELFAELHGGKTLEEVAEDQGVDMEVIQEAMNASRAEAMQQAIEQAVEDGSMSQEQADWMLEGLDQGFFPMRGFGGRGHHPRPVSEGE